MKKNKSSGVVKVDIHMVMTLKALFDTGQVSRAAAVLQVTQPTVSQTLRRLRDYFGDPLFVRVGNSLRPTPRAMELQSSVDRVVREIDSMSQRPPVFDPGTAEREFVVSMTDAAEVLGLSRAIATFSTEAPQCTLRSVRVRTDEVHLLLEDGRLDLAFGSYSSINASLRQLRLGEYGLVCCTARGAIPNLNIETYLAAQHVVVSRFGETDDYAASVLKKLGYTRKVVLRLPNYVAALAAVSQSGVIASVPRHVAASISRIYPIEIRRMPIDLGRVSSYMIWHERFHNDPSHRWLRDILSRNYPVPGRGIEADPIDSE